jgi:hypothetical protein
VYGASYPRLRPIKLSIGLAAAVGFLLSVLFGSIAVLLISPPGKQFGINTVLRIPYVMCPVLLLSDSSSTWWYLSPLTNAALYGAITYLWLRVRRAYGN